MDSKNRITRIVPRFPRFLPSLRDVDIRSQKSSYTFLFNIHECMSCAPHALNDTLHALSADIQVDTLLIYTIRHISHCVLSAVLIRTLSLTISRTSGCTFSNDLSVSRDVDLRRCLTARYNVYILRTCFRYYRLPHA